MLRRRAIHILCVTETIFGMNFYFMKVSFLYPYSKVNKPYVPTMLLIVAFLFIGLELLDFDKISKVYLND